MIKLIYSKEVSTRNRFAIPALLMAPFAMAVIAQMLGYLMLAHAADAPALSETLLALLGDIKDKAVAAVVIMHVFQILRTHEVFGLLGKIGLQGKSLQVAIAVITAFGFVADAYAKGGNIVQALVEGLFTSGGAMAIYDAVNAKTAAVVAAAVPEGK